jgi:hypothetical protein
MTVDSTNLEFNGTEKLVSLCIVRCYDLLLALVGVWSVGFVVVSGTDCLSLKQFILASEFSVLDLYKM